METRSLYSHMEWKGVEAMRTSEPGRRESHASAGSSGRKTLCTLRDAHRSTQQRRAAWQGRAKGFKELGWD